MSSETIVGSGADASRVIAVGDLGKRYRTGITQGAFRYRSMREDISSLTRRVASKQRGRTAEERFVWALRDVAFEVNRGEAVGLIGRNGSGKSTLLKVLSRITPPTEGTVRYLGRVGSLLEVGTGFHPELTGRENILLSGAILGMPKAEIVRRFDEIVEFADIPKFLDTPVKRYSSGMMVRLGFSVAAHLEPDILLVDEVLAVGDAEFQKKCLGRMDDLGSSGRTVIFVSHSMPTILRLCPRAILLDKGRVVKDGPAHQVVRTYLESGLGTTTHREWAQGDAPGDEVVRLKSVRVVAEGGEDQPQDVDIRRAIGIETEYWNLSTDREIRPTVRLRFSNHEGTVLFETHDFNNLLWARTPRVPGVVRATCRLPANFFAEGPVSVTVCVNTINPTVWRAVEIDAVTFDVIDRSEGDGVRGEVVEDMLGVMRPLLDWDVEVDPYIPGG
jgi:lipopolysaccharide transport system ATP-binding protein